MIIKVCLLDPTRFPIAAVECKRNDEPSRLGIRVSGLRRGFRLMDEGPVDLVPCRDGKILRFVKINPSFSYAIHIAQEM
jgi:hypothetical protein